MDAPSPLPNGVNGLSGQGFQANPLAQYSLGGSSMTLNLNIAVHRTRSLGMQEQRAAVGIINEGEEMRAHAEEMPTPHTTFTVGLTLRVY
jgi:hypothetical protein